MTSDQRNQFEAEWPALAVRLQAVLRRKRLSEWVVEDLIQETGCRLIRMWNQIDRAKPLWPLAVTIALNLLRDEMRKGSWSELSRPVPDRPSAEDVETRGLARLELRKLGGALSRMNDSQRSVLLAEVAEAPSHDADPSALRMLRMRARRRLQQLMDQASVLGVTIGIHLRRVTREAEIVIGKALPLDAERLPAAALSIVAALSLGLVALPLEKDAHPDAGTRPDRGAAIEATSGAAGAPPVGAGNIGISSPRSAERGGFSDRTRHRGSGRAGSERQSPEDGDETATGTSYHIPITHDTYVTGSTEVQLEGFGEESKGVPPGGGSLSCSTSASDGAEVSCTHGGDGWSERRARVKQYQEVWVEGERVL